MRATTRAVDDIDLLDHRPPLAWLSPGRSLVGFGEVARFAPGIGRDRFTVAAQSFFDWASGCDVEDEVDGPGTGPIAFASFTFDDRSHGSVMVVPEVVLGRVGDRHFVTTVGDVDPTPLFHPAATGDQPVDRPRYAGASTPDVAYLEAVAAAVSQISSSALRKVVLARDHALWSKLRFDTGRVLRRLADRYPACYTFAVDGLVGASPELLVRSMDTTVESLVLAGTAPRSPDPAEDELLGKALLESEKDLVEHGWAADPVHDELARWCDRVFRSPQPELLELHGLRHLATRFRGKLSDRTDVITLAGRLHPTGAVGGYPTEDAIEMIRRLEGMDRGRYAGPIGWMGAAGDGEMAIALRCAEISGARARLFAGAGVVEESLPEHELEETRLKLRAMLHALGA